MRERKTNRIYGQTYNVIRAFVGFFDCPFTPDVFTPALDYDVARAACQKLAQRGELKIVQPAHMNGRCQVAVYSRP